MDHPHIKDGLPMFYHRQFIMKDNDKFIDGICYIQTKRNDFMIDFYKEDELFATGQVYEEMLGPVSWFNPSWILNSFYSKNVKCKILKEGVNEVEEYDIHDDMFKSFLINVNKIKIKSRGEEPIEGPGWIVEDEIYNFPDWDYIKKQLAPQIKTRVNLTIINGSDAIVKYQVVSINNKPANSPFYLEDLNVTCVNRNWSDGMTSSPD